MSDGGRCSVRGFRSQARTCLNLHTRFADQVGIYPLRWIHNSVNVRSSMDRALAFGARGWEFESFRAYHGDWLDEANC